MSVVDVLRVSPGRGGARAVSGGDETLTYEQLGARVDLRAAELSAARSTPGLVPVVVEPDVEGVVELLALWRAGFVPAPLNPRLSDAERDAAVAGLEGVEAPDGTQAILWTSGTSGRPRGVALSWTNLLASARGAEERLALSPTDVWLASLSPAHVGGLALITRSLILGGTLVASGPLRIDAVAALLEGERDEPITHVSLVPTQLHRLLDHFGARPAPASLRCVLIGGAHAPRSLVDRAVSRGWPLALTYGATEMSSQIATASPELTRTVPGTVGAPMVGVEVRIDEGGELLTRGPTRALAYVGPDAPALADSAGWYHTGDLGRLDDEGRLWITGRRIDRIVSGGVTIDAVEIEEALRAHPTVIDACVVGVPDEEWGERVAAWVEPVEGEFGLEEVERHLRETLSGPKLPRIWCVEGGLPRNANGKVDRAAVRERLNES